MILKVFFSRNLPMQFVLSYSIVEVTINGVKSAKVHSSAIFGFLECLGFRHYDFTWILYHRSYANSRVPKSYKRPSSPKYRCCATIQLAEFCQ